MGLVYKLLLVGLCVICRWPLSKDTAWAAVPHRWAGQTAVFCFSKDLTWARLLQQVHRMMTLWSPTYSGALGPPPLRCSTSSYIHLNWCGDWTDPSSLGSLPSLWALPAHGQGWQKQCSMGKVCKSDIILRWTGNRWPPPPNRDLQCDPLSWCFQSVSIAF